MLNTTPVSRADSRSIVRRFRRIVWTASISAALVSAPASAASDRPRASNELASIELPNGMRITSVVPPGQPGPVAPGTTGAPSFTGDSYSVAHLLGKLIDDVFQCFDVHLAGIDDNIVLFDGLSEALDPYVDGTEPLVFEFETTRRGPSGDETDVVINSFIKNGDSLFLDGVEVSGSGILFDGCLDIGLDSALESGVPVAVRQATLTALAAGQTILPSIDISSFFDGLWDGRLRLILEGIAEQGVDDVRLEITVEPADNCIFKDGFESGDTSVWK